MKSKYEIQLEDATEAAYRIKEAIPTLIAMTGPNGHKVEMPSFLGKDMAQVIRFLNTTAVAKVDELKSILD